MMNFSVWSAHLICPNSLSLTDTHTESRITLSGCLSAASVELDLRKSQAANALTASQPANKQKFKTDGLVEILELDDDDDDSEEEDDGEEEPVAHR